MQPLLALADRAQVFPLHIQTASAAIDLRSPQLAADPSFVAEPGAFSGLWIILPQRKD
jgi:hypothetical protein